VRGAVVAIVAAALLALSPGEALARGKSCREVSDVVGYEHCRRYGAGWSEEKSAAISLELSLGAVFLDPRGRTMVGSFGKRDPSSFRYRGDLVGHSLGVGNLGLRVGYAFTSWAYAGFDFELGMGQNSLPHAHDAGFDVAPTSGTLNSFGLGGGLYGGLRVPIGFVSLRLETLFGGRAIMAGQTTTSEAMVRRGATVSLSTWTIEPRLWLDIWADPWLTLSGFGGLDALHPADRVGGVALGFHGDAYDGAFLW
jgi:hypothetical protein